MAPTLTYFPIRARVELSRLILEYSGTEYHFNAVHGPSFVEIKTSGKLPFGQLPLYEEDNGFSIAQSNTIARYLAKRAGIYGVDDHQAALADQIIDSIADYFAKLIPLIYPSFKKEEMKHFLENEQPKFLAFYEALAVKAGSTADKGFIAGEQLTYADLAVFLLLEQAAESSDLSRWPVLLGIKTRVESIPNIAAYIASERRPAPTKHE